MDKSRKKKSSSHADEILGMGMALGLIFGLAFDNLALGLSIGLALGFGLGNFRKPPKDEAEE